MLPRCSASLLARGLAARAGWARRPVAVTRALCAAASPAEVVRASDAGLLVQSAAPTGQPSSKDALGSGSVVRHEGSSYVCVFRVDRYWWATPLGSSSTQAACWVGKASSGAAAVAAPDFSEEVVRCLRRPTPTQQQRVPLAEGLTTGIIALDTLAPLGKGQSLLVCGPRGSGKSTLAREVLEQAITANVVDQALRFRLEPSAPLVAAPVQSPGVLAEMVVAPEALEKAPAALLAPFFAIVAEAERVRDSGRNALLVLDTVAPLLDAWRLAREWAEQELGRPLETDVAGAQRRGCFSALLERAALLSPSATAVGRGGSLTLVVLAETDEMAAMSSATAGSGRGIVGTDGDQVATFSLDDFAGRPEKEVERLRKLEGRGIALTEASLAAVGIGAPALDAEPATGTGAWDRKEEQAAMRELQSLSDGQVILDGAAAAAGDFPAVAPGATFSRFGLGSSGNSPDQEASPPRRHRDVRPPALQAVAAHLRTQLALERDAGFRPRAVGTPDGGAAAASADDLDSAQSAHMATVRAALLQPPRSPMLPEEMAAVLLSACSGALDAMPEKEASRALRGGADGPLLRHLRESAPKVLRRIAEEQPLSVEAAKELDLTVRLYVALQKAGGSASKS